MKFKNKEELEWSSVVANNSMNRERKAVGVNSYEKDVYLNPITFVQSKLGEGKQVHWMDLCCGQGNALIQAAALFRKAPSAAQLKLEGIDLVDFFGDYTEHTDILQLKKMNLEDWMPKEEYDLITIVHGLHYVGDKLGLLKKALYSLKKDGWLVANLDDRNIKVIGQENSSEILKQYFKKENLAYDSRRNILKIESKRNLNLPFTYIGANDEAGPNYSGQNSVDSIYELAGDGETFE